MKIVKKRIFITSSIIVILAVVIIAFAFKTSRKEPLTTGNTTNSTTITTKNDVTAKTDTGTGTTGKSSPVNTTTMRQTTAQVMNNNINNSSQILFYAADKFTIINDAASVSDIQKLLVKWMSRKMKFVYADITTGFISKQKRLNKPVEIIYTSPQTIKINVANIITELTFTKIFIPTSGIYKNNLFFYADTKYKYGGYIDETLFGNDNSLLEIVSKK